MVTNNMCVLHDIIIIIQEHEKSLESKRQEQEQWEKDVMGAALPFPS